MSGIACSSTVGEDGLSRATACCQSKSVFTWAHRKTRRSMCDVDVLGRRGYPQVARCCKADFGEGFLEDAGELHVGWWFR